MSDPVIEHYSGERVPNPYPPGQLTWQVYHAVRNAVLRCCRRFGPSGPMGECPITTANEPSIADWPLGHPDPVDYLVVDDQYNHERYVYVEVVRPGAFSSEWLRDLVRTLDDYPGWGVGIIAFDKAYILAFSNKLMVTGEIFAECGDLACVVHKGQSEIAKSPQPGAGRQPADPEDRRKS